MNYNEKYSKCETIGELKRVVKVDIVNNLITNPNELNIINEEVNKVLKQKGWINEL